ncbi:MAG: hypothetical protein IPO57_09130 [Rhodocyclales bacterium]|nr:hypothetical protein [Rhodocyclales bacterium]
MTASGRVRQGSEGLSLDQFRLAIIGLGGRLRRPAAPSSSARYPVLGSNLHPAAHRRVASRPRQRREVEPAELAAAGGLTLTDDPAHLREVQCL